MFDWNYWLEIFEARAPQLVIRRPDAGDWLSDEECKRIASSIATFQLGEQSEGRTLLRFAEKFARRRNLPALPRVTALFIREEQHHAAQLKTFMEANGIPLKRHNWTDSVFVYYRALARATTSRLLKAICRGMCADESLHLRYETQLLMTLRGDRRPFARRVVERLHRSLLYVSARIVFIEHRSVLRHAGYDSRGFVRDCQTIYRMVMRTGVYRPRERDSAGHLAS
jgi:hypothetical protein